VPILSGLAPDPRQSGYLLVDVDRGRFASLPGEALTSLRLDIGREIPAPVLARLRELADIEGACRAALRALTRRPHARRDLGRKLVKKQHPPAAVEAALQRLEARGLIDDRRFAELYAAVRATRGRGPARLVKDLLAQGVDARVAEESVRRALEDEGLTPEIEARAVAAKRVRQLADLPPMVRKRRLLAFLARRGYAGAAALELVRELLER
jgi:regulatory protein